MQPAIAVIEPAVSSRSYRRPEGRLPARCALPVHLPQMLLDPVRQRVGPERMRGPRHARDRRPPRHRGDGAEVRRLLPEPVQVPLVVRAPAQPPESDGPRYRLDLDVLSVMGRQHADGMYRQRLGPETVPPVPDTSPAPPAPSPAPASANPTRPARSPTGGCGERRTAPPDGRPRPAPPLPRRRPASGSRARRAPRAATTCRCPNGPQTAPPPNPSRWRWHERWSRPAAATARRTSSR